MQRKRFVDSFNAAIEGFVYAVRTERNMRVHFLVAVLLVLLAIYLNFTKTELMVLCGTITFVLVCEMLNTVVELLVDMVVESEYHPMAKIIKDVAAGCVLVASLNAMTVGYILFTKKIPFSIEEGIWRLRQSSWHLTFVAFLIVLSLVIFGKALSRKGTPLRGGMPSGHAALAFTMWTIITFLTTNSVVSVLVFMMAFLIARYRVKEQIHSVWEVLVGGLLGILVTTLLFQLLK
jgi:diacylglycerol kinase (ATP)